MFDLDGFTDDAFDGFGMRATFEVREEEAGEIGVESFVSGNELVLVKSDESKSVTGQADYERTGQHTEKVNPGMRPRFLSQKMEAKDPEKKIPSTAAKATRRSPKTEASSEIHLSAQSAFFLMQGTGEKWKERR